MKKREYRSPELVIHMIAVSDTVMASSWPDGGDVDSTNKLLNEIIE